MIMVTNTIQILKGHGAQVAERFRNPKGVHTMPGFVSMELLLSEEGDNDELKVCTAWESKEAFDNWVNSDAFKQAHSHRGGKPAEGGAQQASAEQQGQSGGQSEAKPPSIMLGSKLSIHQILHKVTAAAPAQ